MEYSEFKNKTVLITGAAGIFGGWIARAFARNGASLILSDINEGKLKTLQEELRSENVDVMTHVTDLKKIDSIDDLVTTVINEHKYVDVLINNAGLYPSHLLLEMDYEQWREVMQVNLDAVFLLSQKLAKLMVQHDVKGSIINIGSGAAFSTRPGSGHYSASKAGLAMLTRSFALELAPHHIRINSITPGFSSKGNAEKNHLDSGYIEKVVAGIPLGRESGEQDTPEMILFLCSNKASYITGTNISVDGGKGAGNFTIPRSSTKEGD